MNPYKERNFIISEKKQPRARRSYMPEFKQQLIELTAAIIDIFTASRNNYGTRKIKRELKKNDMIMLR